MAATNQKETIMQLRDTSANPAPLGLMGFGMTTILLNLHNIGLFPLDAMILSMGIFYGGLAQIIAGIMEWKKNNTFGETAFISYGFFWLTLVGIILMPVLGLSSAPTDTAMAAYLFMWGLFTVFLFLGTLKLNKALIVVFGSLATVFMLLPLAHAIGSPFVTRIAGIVGLFCGSSAIYTAMAQVLNGIYGKVVLPLGAIK